MNKVAIFCDSTCDLSKEILEQYNINVLPLHVVFGEESYLDGVEIAGPQVIAKADEKGFLPNTQGVAPDEAYNAFKSFVDDGYDIFYLGIGSGLSSTFNSVRLASMEFDEGRVWCLDSKNLTTGAGILILKACKYRDKGMSAEEIYKKVETKLPYVKAQFVIRSLDYMAKGGRCPSLLSRVTNVLRVRPLIVVRNNSLKVGSITIGLMDKAIKKMSTVFLKHLNRIDRDFVFVTYSPGCEKYIEQITEEFKENNVFDKIHHVYFTDAGSVVTSHCGEGTIGILYLTEKDDNIDDFIE